MRLTLSLGLFRSHAHALYVFAGSLVSDVDALYARLSRLIAGQMAQVIGRLPDPVVHQLPLGASPAELALAMRNAAKLDPEVKRHLQGALDELNLVPQIDAADAFAARQLTDAEHVPIIGFHDKRRVRLRIDDVYVPLGFGNPDHGWGRKLGGDDAASDALGLPGGGAHALRDIRIEEGLAAVEQRIQGGAVLHGVAVVGLPGSGKTTLIKHVFREVRAKGSAAVGLPEGLTPVVLRAGRVIEDMPAQGRAQALRAVSLADVLEREARATDTSFAGAGRALSQQGRLLLLVDALDEAGGEVGLRDVCNWLERQMVALPDHRWLVTCRYAAWQRASGRLQGALRTLHVRDLTLEAANTYVRSWFRAVARREEGESVQAFDTRAAELADTITDPGRLVSGRLREMVGNPLMLSLVCLVHHTLGHLPRARAKLYDECLGVLLVAWAEHKARAEGARHAQVQVDVDAATRLLMPLAWRMQETQDGDAPVDLPRDDIVATFREGIPRIPALQGRTAPDLFALLSEHCGVLHSPDLRQYRFVHLSFQEFLAARHAESRTDQGARELAARLGDSRWAEPILLALSRGTLVTPFWKAVLRRFDAAKHEPQLRQALAQGDWVDEAPFLEVLAQAARWGHAPWWQRWLAPGWPPVSTVRLVLDLLANRDSDAVRQAAAPLRRHSDPGIAQRARALWGQAAHGQAPGARRVVDCGGVPLEVVWVPAGTFWMGATKAKGPHHDPEAYARRGTGAAGDANARVLARSAPRDGGAVPGVLCGGGARGARGVSASPAPRRGAAHHHGDVGGRGGVRGLAARPRWAAGGPADRGGVGVGGPGRRRATLSVGQRPPNGRAGAVDDGVWGA